MSVKRLRIVTLLWLGAITSVAQAQVVSSFDSGLDGWTGTGGTVTYVSTGGNPGGFLQESDLQSTYMSVLAPAKFLGNLSGYFNGTLSFDGKNINNLASDLPAGPWFGTVTITGANGTASRAVAGEGAGNPPPDGSWHSYSAKLDPALWTGNLAVALANVTQLSVVLEFNNTVGAEVAGFDNFRISPVPEVPRSVLLTSGILLLLVRRKA